MRACFLRSSFFFFNDTATTEIYPLPLHDALPISACSGPHPPPPPDQARCWCGFSAVWRCSCRSRCARSEEHTSELQSPCNLVCRLLLEKKKTTRLRLSPHSPLLHVSTRHTLSLLF